MAEQQQADMAALYAEEDRLAQEMNRILRMRRALRPRIQAEEAILRQAAMLARVRRESAS
jgi:hypothetical protein